jgi:hypothetical protein
MFHQILLGILGSEINQNVQNDSLQTTFFCFIVGITRLIVGEAFVYLHHLIPRLNVSV